MQVNIAYKSNEWYDFRKTHIGASEAGAVMGLSPFMSNIDLWGLKTGLNEPKDLSDNKLVEYGIKAEEHLARLFELDFPQYKFIDSKDIVLVSEELPFVMASPDGLLVDNQTGEKGFWECKTTEDRQGNAKKEWRANHIPDHYYCQLLHTFLADKTLTFAVITCQIKYITENGENCFKETLNRKIYRKDVEKDIAILQEKEIEFWGYVERNEKPPLKLVLK
jgi:putative phage-type endonuclease